MTISAVPLGLVIDCTQCAGSELPAYRTFRPYGA